jgi:UDP-N-acetylmuramoyl-tripeptide--D-alanyl-D-alanine ligase
MTSLTDARVLTFGRAGNADVRVVDLVLDDLARAHFTVISPWGTVDVSLGVSGEHMALNAAAALAVAGACGVDLGAAALALGQAGMSPWRMEIDRTASGAVLINDAYNANPASMRAALETLAQMHVGGRRVAVLGVMAELSDPVADHTGIAELARQAGIEIIAVGTELYGVTPTDDPVAAVGSLAGDDALLVKGSRVAGLERVAQLLLRQ